MAEAADFKFDARFGHKKY